MTHHSSLITRHYFSLFQRQSIKTRVTLTTLAIFLISIWSLAFYASRMLRADMQRLLGEQQFSTVSFMAAAVNEELVNRLRSLENISEQVSPAILGNPAALQALLVQRPILQILFSGGTFVTGIDGTAIASIPLSLGRVGVNYLDRDSIVAALKEGKATIGRPVMGKKLMSPIFIMAVPIRDTQGKVIGALMGVTDLRKPNFLDKITEGRYGKTGAYFLTARQYRLIVTTSDRSRIMESLPAPGINPMIDRAIKGYEGTLLYVNPLGVEQLASVKGVPVADWYVAVALPTAEAFAPIRALQQRLLLATILVILLVGGLTWWILKRQLSPMPTAMKTLAALSDTDQPPPPLPITRKNEIGDLIGGFNRLLETLGQREEVLKESEENFCAIANYTVDWESWFGVDGKILWMNPAVERITGYSVAEALAMPDFISTLIKAEDRDLFTATFQDAVHGSKGDDLDFRYVHKNGSTFWMGVSYQQIFDTQGHSLGIRASGRDITERKRVEEEIKAKNQELENYLYSASHDLRSPLVNIQGFSQRLQKQAVSIKTLLSDTILAPETKEGIEQITDEGIPRTLNFIISNVTKMDGLLNGLLQISRTGRTVMTIKKIDMNQLFKTVTGSYNHPLIELEAIITAAELPFCYGDENMLYQVISNIIGNAIKYREQGKPLTIDISAHQEFNKVLYSIKDNGIGLDPRHLAKIWNVFYRVDPDSGDAGDGLGLSIVKRIVDKHKGRVWAESELGKGSVFCIELQAKDFQE